MMPPGVVVKFKGLVVFFLTAIGYTQLVEDVGQIGVELQGYLIVLFRFFIVPLVRVRVTDIRSELSVIRIVF